MKRSFFPGSCMSQGHKVKTEINEQTSDFLLVTRTLCRLIFKNITFDSTCCFKLSFWLFCPCFILLGSSKMPKTLGLLDFPTLFVYLTRSLLIPSSDINLKRGSKLFNKVAHWCIFLIICLVILTFVNYTFQSHYTVGVDRCQSFKQRAANRSVLACSSRKISWSLASLLSREKSGSSGQSLLALWAILDHPGKRTTVTRLLYKEKLIYVMLALQNM